MKLTHRIEVQSTTKLETKRSHGDSKNFHKTFPFFIWLLRDVLQAIPRDCSNIKDYFLKKVILGLTPERNIEYSQQFGGLLIKRLVRRILLPKNSINDGELVTGEGKGRLSATFVTL